jgi:hypothetical protein
MRLHILVEGASEQALLEAWLPRFLPSGHTYKIIRHQGKGKLPKNPSEKPNPRHHGLLDQLPAKLRAFGKSFNPETDRVLVLVDSDNDDCFDLKNRMTDLLNYCKEIPTVLFRIAIEETEAFYLGDLNAVKKAFPKAKKKNYVQDSICGTWELFRDVIGEESENKVGWAKQIGLYLTTQWKGTQANRSASFRHFCKAILYLAGEISEK